MGFEADFAKWKNSEFGTYCMTKCKATCCDMRNASLHINELELKALFGKEIEPAEHKAAGIREAKERGLYYLDADMGFCPKFDTTTRKCLDYARRPKSCREFPFLVENDAVVIKSGCSLGKGDPAYRKLVELASRYGKVIVKRAGR